MQGHLNISQVLRSLEKIGLLLFLLLVAACTNPPYHGSDVVGADDFVMDSYRIREGKFAILSMEGREPGELSADLLEEYQDVINNGDVLQIAIYHPTRSDLADSVQRIGQTVGFKVIEGKVFLPDLPPIQLSGLTLLEAQEKIQSFYREQIKDVSVFSLLQRETL